MPVPALQSMADQYGKSLADMERYWNRAKAAAGDMGYGSGTSRYWRAVMGLTKRFAAGRGPREEDGDVACPTCGNAHQAHLARLTWGRWACGCCGRGWRVALAVAEAIREGRTVAELWRDLREAEYVALEPDARIRVNDVLRGMNYVAYRWKDMIAIEPYLPAQAQEVAGILARSGFRIVRITAEGVILVRGK